MDKKKKAILLSIAIIALIVVLTVVNGFEFNIVGVISLNSKNYPTANEAYIAGSDTIENINDTAVVNVDDYNAFYVASAGENELIIAQMKTVASMYYYLGYQTVYDLANGRVDGFYEGELETTITPKLVSKSTYGGEIEWALVKASDAGSVSNDFVRVEIDAKINGETLVFLYKIND